MNAVVAFPYQKKRGAKTRKGPCAEIVQLHRCEPEFSKREMEGIELLVQAGKSEQWARSVFGFLKIPWSLNEDGETVRNGETIPQFFDRLRRERV
jgi:hypothetical protein